MGIFSSLGAFAYAFGGQVVQNEVSELWAGAGAPWRTAVHSCFPARRRRCTGHRLDWLGIELTARTVLQVTAMLKTPPSIVTSMRKALTLT